jgi:hypothetical protein
LIKINTAAAAAAAAAKQFKNTLHMPLSEKGFLSGIFGFKLF